MLINFYSFEMVGFLFQLAWSLCPAFIAAALLSLVTACGVKKQKYEAYTSSIEEYLLIYVKDKNCK